MFVSAVWKQEKMLICLSFAPSFTTVFDGGVTFVEWDCGLQKHTFFSIYTHILYIYTQKCVHTHTHRYFKICFYCSTGLPLWKLFLFYLYFRDAGAV